MNRSSTMRTPAVGVVPPYDEVLVTIEKPLARDEIPVVFSRDPAGIIVHSVRPTSAVVENKTGRPAFYCLVVVPRKFVHMIAIPWKDMLKKADRKSILQFVTTQLRRWFTRDLDQ